MNANLYLIVNHKSLLYVYLQLTHQKSEIIRLGYFHEIVFSQIENRLAFNKMQLKVILATTDRMIDFIDL